jgi:hypothetical protein
LSPYIIDYVIGTQNLFQFIESFDVSERNILSDHCIVAFPFVFDKSWISDIDTEYYYVKYKYVWSNDMKNDFLEGLSSNCMLEKLSIFTEQVQQAENK